MIYKGEKFNDYINLGKDTRILVFNRARRIVPPLIMAKLAGDAGSSRHWSGLAKERTGRAPLNNRKKLAMSTENKFSNKINVVKTTNILYLTGRAAGDTASPEGTILQIRHVAWRMILRLLRL
ncbi:hypothetical protein KAX97_11355 [candidate division WOR-3 bacterium]|nr:hypothetical protein [candidate division WOR-3 bacterium]